MSVAILGGTSGLVWLVGIVHVDEDYATCTGVVAAGAATTSNCGRPALFFVGDDVMRAAGDAVSDVHPTNIFRNQWPCVESLGFLGGELEQLLHVEELDSVTDSLTADDQSVSDLLDLTPDDAVVAGGETSEVFELAVLGDLSEGCTVGLTDGDELTALVSPSPAAGSFTNSVAKLGVGLEVVHVLEVRVRNNTFPSPPFNISTYNVVARVGLVLVALDGHSLAILALDDILVGTLLAKAVPLLAVVVAHGSLVRPSSLFGAHHKIHDIASFELFGRKAGSRDHRQDRRSDGRNRRPLHRCE
jgi:hypothetical protein